MIVVHYGILDGAPAVVARFIPKLQNFERLTA